MEKVKGNWVKRILGFLRLSHERESSELIHEAIEKAIVFRGTNLWILIFAIIIASVGLNLNSTAVVIGAMLISPLMGPINGIGYSIATYNFDLFKRSLKNYGFAAVAGLITSTVYFLITPIHTEQSELLMRTSPSIYDVFIAMFGGLAGIVAISSKNKGNVLPGVAIATALMPPLCTAAYGISIGNASYFFGAMYLFLINTVFIALSAMLVSQLLSLPKRSFLLSREIKNTKIVVAIVIVLTVIPSVYLGYTLVRKEKFMFAANAYIRQVEMWEGNYLLDDAVDGDLRTITLVYLGDEIDESCKKRIILKARTMGLSDAKIEVHQGFQSSVLASNRNNASQIDRLKTEFINLSQQLDKNTKQLDSIQRISTIGTEILNEIHTLFPQVLACSYSESPFVSVDGTKGRSVPMVYLKTDGTLTKDNKSAIERWLKKRLKSDQVVLHF